MGQRANYIIKEGNAITLYYNHWRANAIARDLYLGEERFVAFAKDCQPAEELLEEAWIEGCVLLDYDARVVSFWSLEFPDDTSVVDYYLSKLSTKWAGWKVDLLRNRMYDIASLLRIDYVAQQELQTPHVFTTEKIVADKVEDWTNALVLIRDDAGWFVTKTGDLVIETLVSYGPAIIPLLLVKQPYPLPNEGDEGTEECVVFDSIEKKLFVNKSSFGLWEQCHSLWTGYTFTMGDYGYLDALTFAGIDHADHALNSAEVEAQFQHLVQLREDFDPNELAERIRQDHNDVQFNPQFFDATQPSKTLVERLTLRLRNLLGRK
ncbi:MAG: hypothetical protein J0H74_14245 [Chitinophagaceae bacterium]|nr:hypothetical protein [Chitinophagaceae bacterium]